MEKFFKHPWIIVAVIGIITLFFSLQIPRVHLDNNNLRFIPGDDEARLVSKYIDDTFGSSLFVLVGLERKYGTVFEGDFLRQIREYVARIEEIDIVDPVYSIVTSDYITSDEDAIVVEKLVSGDFSGTPEEITELKRRILSWDMYERALVSDDFTATQIMVPLNVNSENAGEPEAQQAFTQVRDIAREMFGGMAEVYVTGIPVISATVNEAVHADLILLVPLVIVVVLAVLFFSFRRFTSVVLPLLTVLVAVIWSIGAMPLFHINMSIISTVLPVILVAVGSAYGIHVVTHYNTEMTGRGAISDEEHRRIIYNLIRTISKPVFLAALTTFAGFVSFCFTRVLPIREYGFFSSFGVLVSFGVALTLIPALLIIRGPRELKERKRAGKEQAGVKQAAGYQAGEAETDPMSGAIADAFLGITRKKRFVLILTAVVALVSVYGLTKVIIDNVMVEYFKTTTDIYKSDRFIRNKFGGSKVVSVVAQADTPEELLSPESLKAMEGLSRFLEDRVGEVGKVMGFTDLVKRINQVFNADESPEGIASRALPADAGSGGFGFSGDDFGFGFDAGDDFGLASDESGEGGFGFYEDAEAPEPRAGDEVYTLRELTALLDNASSGSRTMDAGSLVWELKKRINYEGASYYEIPLIPERYGKQTPEELQQLVSNYLVLLSGNIDEYANDSLEPTAIKTTVQLRTVGQYDTNRALDEIHGYINANFPKNLRVVVGGSAIVEDSLNRLVVQSQLISVVVSLFMVFLIIAVSNRSIVAGCIGIAPLSISILINFAVMGFLGIKLNIGTSMVASVSVGIGIDYTIHYLEAFKREYRTGGKNFLRRTFTTSGKAIIINAVSVGAGFAVLLLSQFNMLAGLGLLIALTMGTSALISLTVIPVLLLIINPRFVRKNSELEGEMK
ncbi:MAG: MMPL family transporter [Treponema sp.]|jgi:predicted RND superfamily exporter protein|nr:MMPL family transporter [Treponema sp.]